MDNSDDPIDLEEEEKQMEEAYKNLQARRALSHPSETDAPRPD